MNRVVLDTNTLISGLLWDGNESIVIEKAEKKNQDFYIIPDVRGVRGSFKKAKNSLKSLKVKNTLLKRQ